MEDFYHPYRPGKRQVAQLFFMTIDVRNGKHYTLEKYFHVARDID
jgi:hypothetical protein